MSKKKVAVAVVGVAFVLLAGLVFWQMFKKDDGLKLGMSYDEVLAFVENHEYTQEGLSETDDGIIFTIKGDDIDIDGVKGYLFLRFDSENSEDNILRQVNFQAVGIDSMDVLNEQVEVLKDYISERYGELVLAPDEGGSYFEIYNVLGLDDIAISLYCPYGVGEGYDLLIAWSK